MLRARNTEKSKKQLPQIDLSSTFISTHYVFKHGTGVSTVSATVRVPGTDMKWVKIPLETISIPFLEGTNKKNRRTKTLKKRDLRKVWSYLRAEFYLSLGFSVSISKRSTCKFWRLGLLEVSLKPMEASGVLLLLFCFFGRFVTSLFRGDWVFMHKLIRWSESRLVFAFTFEFLWKVFFGAKAVSDVACYFLRVV